MFSSAGKRPKAILDSGSSPTRRKSVEIPVKEIQTSEITVKDLTSKERCLYDAVSEAVQNGGDVLALRRASRKANCSIKTIKRKMEAFKESGIAAFKHGNAGKQPATTYDDETKMLVTGDYIANYPDASFTHYSEILAKDRGLDISPTTLHRWLWVDFCISPLATKKVKQRMQRRIRAEMRKKELSKADKKKLDVASNILDQGYAHPHRARSKYFGEMIQMDASEYKWNGVDKWHLHLAVDDATGEFVGAWFDTQETLDGYYNVLKMILEKYGIPGMFYTDRRTVFTYESKVKKQEEEDTMTQFSACCCALGIDIKTTSIPQCKGRIERSNYTFQKRLPVDLRRAGITGIDEANSYLDNVWLDEMNSKFSLLEEEDRKTSVFLEAPPPEKINQLLARVTKRVIDAGQCVKYRKKLYYPVTAGGRRPYFRKGTEALVIEAFDKTLFLNISDVLYSLVETEARKNVSDEYDDKSVEEPKARRRYVPPITHPWRLDFYRRTRKQQEAAIE